MKNNSRTDFAIKNVGIAGLMQAISILLNFISRTIFVKLLGNDYLSCDGLFTNILTILSFSELGIGSAIIFSLYKPIAEDDKKQIGKLLNLFKNAYLIITIIITTAGVCLIPFLKYLISDVPNVKENITLLYLLFLFNTVASYIFGYKRSYLIANQKNYIVVLIHHGMNLIKIIIQIIILLLTHNYILYLILNILATLFTNIVTTIITDKKYPWINNYNDAKLLKEERKPIFQNIFSIFQYKLGSVILNGTDNIIISTVLKTSLVGLVSNYNMIISAVQTVASQACSGLQATVGNFNVKSSENDRYRTFCKLYFISCWGFGFFAVSLATLLTPFVQNIWLGNKYVIPYDAVLALSVSFYINLINTVPSIYRTTLGYFKEARFAPMIASLLNIILSVVLAKIIGLSGVFWATAISRVLTFNIIDPHYVFKRGFNMTPFKYYKIFLTETLMLIINYLITFYSVSLIHSCGIMGFILKAILNCIVFNFFFILTHFKNPSFKDTLLILKRMCERKVSK